MLTLASGEDMARPTVAMWVVFHVLLSTITVRFAIAVVWYLRTHDSAPRILPLIRLQHLHHLRYGLSSSSSPEPSHTYP